jgi:hypothetical protein
MKSREVIPAPGIGQPPGFCVYSAFHLNVQVELTTGSTGRAKLNILVFPVLPVVCYSWMLK